MDVSGKTVRTYVHTIEEMHKFSFGSDLRSGAYFAKVKQGEHVKVIKLVKLN